MIFFEFKKINKMKEININGTIYQNPLLVFALEVEAQEEFNDFQKIFTGVGKINAAYHLFKGIEKYNPDIIINLGTAGSTAFNKGMWCVVRNLSKEIWM